MINTIEEEPIPLDQIPAEHIPGRGKPVHQVTLSLWYRRGIRGVKLETILIGGRRCTSLPALNRFYQAISAARSSLPSHKGAAVPPAIPAPSARRARPFAGRWMIWPSVESDRGADRRPPSHALDLPSGQGGMLHTVQGLRPVHAAPSLPGLTGPRKRACGHRMAGSEADGDYPARRRQGQGRRPPRSMLYPFVAFPREALDLLERGNLTPMDVCVLLEIARFRKGADMFAWVTQSGSSAR